MQHAPRNLHSMVPPGTPSTKVGYITDPKMCKHKDPNNGKFGVHQERPERLEVLDEALGHLKPRLTLLVPREATKEELQTCHDPEYIREVYGIAGWTPEDYKRHSQRKGFNYYCEGTLTAALLAAGCVTAAMEAVLSNKVGAAFCAVRPPSHHAGTEGATNKSLLLPEQSDIEDDKPSSPVCPEEATSKGQKSMKQKAPAADAAAAASCGEAAPQCPCPRGVGFCFFSNVGCAAALAASGNLVNASSTSPPIKRRRVVVLDWDVHHGDGLEQVLSDKEDVFFVSLHRHGDIGGGKPFYPGTGAVDSCLNKGWNLNIPFEGKGYGDADYQAAFSLVVLPILEELEPDLIIVAAGFDAVLGDLMGEFCLSAEMYGHMLSQLRRVQPKVVLALEGGYNPQLVGACAQSCIKVLLRGQDVSGDPELQELQGEDAYEPMPGGVRGTPKKATMSMLRRVSGLMARFWSSMRDFTEREEAYNAEVSQRNKASWGWRTSGLDQSLIISTPEGTSSTRQSRLRKPTAKVAASAAAGVGKKQLQQQRSSSPPQPLMAAAGAPPLPAAPSAGASLKKTPSAPAAKTTVETSGKAAAPSKSSSTTAARKNKRKAATDAVVDANTTPQGSRKSSRISSRRSMTPATPTNTAVATAAADAKDDSPPPIAATMVMPEHQTVTEDGSSGAATPAPTTPDASMAPTLPTVEETMTPPAADEPFMAPSEESAGSVTPAPARGRGVLAAMGYTGISNITDDRQKNNKRSRSRRASETSEDSSSSPPGTAISADTSSKRRRVAASATPSAASMTLSDAFAATLDDDVSSALLLPEQLFVSSSSLLPEWPSEGPQQQQGGAAAASTENICQQQYRYHHRRLSSNISTDDTLIFYSWEE